MRPRPAALSQGETSITRLGTGIAFTMMHVFKRWQKKSNGDIKGGAGHVLAGPAKKMKPHPISPRFFLDNPSRIYYNNLQLLAPHLTAKTAMNTKSSTRSHSSLDSRYDEKDAFARLARACEDNDERAVIEIRNEIMLANGGLVRSLARKACRYYGFLGLSTTTMSPDSEATYSENDFIQHGYILLEKAIRKYDLSAGVKFSTYATTVVGRGLNQIFNARALKKYATGGFVSLDSEVGGEDGERRLADFIPDKNSGRGLRDYYMEDVRRMLAVALSTLTPREKKVVLLSQGFGCDKLKLAEIAQMMGVTPQRVTQILKGALCKLRIHPAIKELDTVV